MKKQVIAAAVAAAFSVPAMAQFTISGIIDHSIASTKDGGVTLTQQSSNTLSSGQFVFGGTEDLGGGLKANVIVRTTLRGDVPAATTIGDRGSMVGIEGGFGSIGLGRTTGTHTTNSVITAGPLGNLTSIGSIMDTTGTARATTLAARPQNSLQYSTPTMSGFRAQVIYATDAGGAEAAGSGDQFTEASAYFNVGGVTASLGYGTQRNVGGVAGTNASDISASLRANVGPAAVHVRYLGVNYEAAAQNANEHTGWALGGSLPISGSTNLVAEYVNNKAGGGAQPATKVALGLINNLSKRTNVYAAGYSESQTGAATGAETVMAVGVRHSF